MAEDSLDGASRTADSEKVLILGTAVSSRLLAVGRRIASRRRPAKATVCVPEVETWKFRNQGFHVVVVGNEDLPLEAPELRAVVERGQFDRVMLPLGFPRASPLGAWSLVRSMSAQSFEVDFGLAAVRWRPAIAVVLVLFHLAAWVPLRVLERLCSNLDGVGVVLGNLVARRLTRRVRGDGRDGVCHVIPSLGTGGTQRQLVEYVRRAQPGPPLVLIALFDHSDRFLRELENSGLEVEILARACRGNALGRAAIRLFPSSTAMIVLAKKLKRMDVSCVVSWLFQANLIAVPAARWAGVERIVASIRNLSTWKSWPEYRKWWYRPADRLAASSVDSIFANSQAAARDYARWVRRPDLEVLTILNGLDIDGFLSAPRRNVREALDLAPDRMIILSVGRLSAEKDHGVLLRALSSMSCRCPPWHLLLVGHGRLEQELRRLAVELEIANAVSFVGRVDDPQSYYSAADLFVLPSRIEGAPNAMIEAQAFGLAAVTTSWEGVDEVVEAGVTAEIVPIGDVEALAARVEALLADEGRRSEMGRRAAAVARRKFAIEPMVQAVDALSGRR